MSIRLRSRSLAHSLALALVAAPLAVLATATPAHAATTDIQILATNDFHGRLLPNGAEGGAAVLSGAVKQLSSANPNTVFTAAGDLIGASTFESFIADDEPTIDVLNEAGLEVSAVGNHELDQGYADLVGRVQDRANWEYIAANIEEPGGADDIAETWIKDFGDVEVGFVGAVTEDLPSLVSPAGIAGLTVTDIVDATNAAATDLKTAGADVVVLLVHEGAPGTSLASSTTDTNAFSAIVNGVSPDVDAIVSGHTHLAYNHSVPVPAWVTEGRAVTERPVVSAGQYGTNLNQLVFTVDTATGDVSAKTQAILPMNGPDPDGTGPGVPPAALPGRPGDRRRSSTPPLTNAEVLGAVELGDVAGAFNRARWSDRTDTTTRPDIVENRGGESTLGNLVAEVQRWATEPAEFGAAQIAFMNPGGLRANMAGPTVVPTQAGRERPAVRQHPGQHGPDRCPDQDGAGAAVAARRRGQRADAAVPAGSAPPRASSTPTTRPLPEGSRITGIWLNGAALSPTATYSVTVNSFLASGGDNFRELRRTAPTSGTPARSTCRRWSTTWRSSPARGPPLPSTSRSTRSGATVTDADHLALVALA